MKLGIVSVFMPKEGDDPLVDLYFEQFRKNTLIDYTIYCHIDKATLEFQKQISSYSKAIPIQIPETDLVGFREHSYYLSRLITEALKSCTHIAIFHPDSFPIIKGWAPGMGLAQSASWQPSWGIQHHRAGAALAHPDSSTAPSAPPRSSRWIR